MTALATRLSQLSAERRWSAAALLLLVVSFAWSAASGFLSADSINGVDPFLRALAEHRAELQAGDTVLVHPPWRDDVLDAFEREQSLPDGVSATVALALPHGQSPQRVLLLADPALPLPRSRARQLGAEVKRHAGVNVAWLAAEPGETGAVDLGARVALAEVHVQKADGTIMPCAWQGRRNRHICPGLPDWMFVGPEARTIGGRAESCIGAHPISGGKVVIQWKDGAWPSSLELSHGLTDQAATNPKGAPVTMTVFADGAQVLRSVRTNARGMLRQRLKVPSSATSLKLEITTPNDGARHYCWQLHGVSP